MCKRKAPPTLAGETGLHSGNHWVCRSIPLIGAHHTKMSINPNICTTRSRPGVPPRTLLLRPPPLNSFASAIQAALAAKGIAASVTALLDQDCLLLSCARYKRRQGERRGVHVTVPVMFCSTENPRSFLL